MNEKFLTVRQAAILTDYSERGVRKASESGRWPATQQPNGTWVIDPVVLIERYALAITHELTREKTRKRLGVLAEAACYPLDLDALEIDARAHIRRLHDLNSPLQLDPNRVDFVER